MRVNFTQCEGIKEVLQRIQYKNYSGRKRRKKVTRDMEKML